MESKKSSYPLQEFLKGQVKPCLSTEDYTKLVRLINDFVRIRFFELAKKENRRERLIYSAQEIKAICKITKCKDCPFCYGFRDFTYLCLMDRKDNDGAMPKEWVV